MIVESEDGRVILSRRPATGLLANMFEFPQMLVDNTSDNAALCETARTVFGNVLQATPSDLAASLSVLTGTELGRVQHIFSHIRLTMIVFHFRLLDSHNLPTTIEQPFKIVSLIIIMIIISPFSRYIYLLIYLIIVIIIKGIN